MEVEQRELYVYTKDHFIEDLKRISPNCVSPIIATRQVVKRAIDQYVADYCTNNESPFGKDDFQAVSNTIRDEIMNGSL